MEKVQACRGMTRLSDVATKRQRTAGNMLRVIPNTLYFWSLIFEQWIDTCCIDKTSSAELSEAINSMFSWYQKSQVCYAYLSDVSSSANDHYKAKSEFRRSNWFTRGWTLQELLAPKFVEFYDQNWVEIGTRAAMQKLLHEITGIRTFDDIGSANVAEKMSWASRRVTTRIEDQAYCLMGLFGVNMPLLYGEGAKAFLRLQLEIWNMTNDESIFAWGDLAKRDDLASMDEHYDYLGASLLAEKPIWFIDCGNSRSLSLRSDADPTQVEIAVSIQGVRLTIPLLPVLDKDWVSVEEFFAPLSCGPASEDKHAQRCFVLHLIKKPTWQRSWEIKEMNFSEILENIKLTKPISTTIYIPGPRTIIRTLESPRLPDRFLLYLATGLKFLEWTATSFKCINVVNTRFVAGVPSRTFWVLFQISNGSSNFALWCDRSFSDRGQTSYPLQSM